MKRVFLRSPIQLTIMTVGLLALSISAWAGSSGPVLFGSGTAQIDGVMSPAEWDGAGKIDFPVNLPRGGTVTGTLYVMNDNANLYTAVTFPYVAPKESFSLHLDKDHDGSAYSHGDDAYGYNSYGLFSDNVYWAQAPCPSGQICCYEDTTVVGTTDGTGHLSTVNGITTFELSHPINSTDIHDINLIAGGMVGFIVDIRTIIPPEQWPVDFGDTYFPNYPTGAQLGEIIITPARPTANASNDQSVHPGSTVTLDGSLSSDIDSNYPLTYSWQLANKPPASNAVLANASTAKPSFVADLPGTYEIQLTVTDSKGMQSPPDTVAISTYNTPPVAEAGPGQVVVQIGSLVSLNGGSSYDEDGDPVNYEWSFASRPTSSSATITNPASAMASFVADANGAYEVTLKVTDIWGATATDFATVSFNNLKPVANAGGNQSINLGQTATLNGSKSSDPNLDPLTYRWSLAARPAGSAAALIPVSATPWIANITPDTVGDYIVNLVVNDGKLDSDTTALSNVSIKVTSYRDKAINLIQGAISTINALDPTLLKNANMANALTNKLNEVLTAIEQGDYAAAIDKLENDILAKIDGCSSTAQKPDKNDWILSCPEQVLLYQQLSEIIATLRSAS